MAYQYCKRIYKYLCLFILLLVTGLTSGFGNCNTVTTRNHQRRASCLRSTVSTSNDHHRDDSIIAVENEIASFRRTGIKRVMEWDSISKPVPLQNEITLLESGVLVQKGEFCRLYGDRLDDVKATCENVGMTLRQGLLVRKQLMVSKVMRSSWKLKDERKLGYIIRRFQRQQSPLELSRDLDLPPVSLIRAVISQRVGEAYPDMLERDQKKIVRSIIGEKDPDNVKQFLSAWELQELHSAKEVDVVGYNEESQTPRLWEEALYDYLDTQEINYASESGLRDAEMKITPDCLMLDDCYINGQLVRWVDVKSFYGSGLRENIHFTKSLKKQIQKYETEFGAGGAVIFKHGFSSKLESTNPTTLILDAGPLWKDSIVDEREESV